MPDAAVKQSVRTDVVNLHKCKLVNELAYPKLTAVTLKVRTLWRGTGNLGESTSLKLTRQLACCMTSIDESSSCYVMQPSKCVDTDVADLRRYRAYRSRAHSRVRSKSAREA